MKVSGEFDEIWKKQFSWKTTSYGQSLGQQREGGGGGGVSLTLTFWRDRGIPVQQTGKKII